VIVVDASAILDVVLRTRSAHRVFPYLREHEGSLHAPHLLDAEVGQVLRRILLRGDIRPRRVAQAIRFVERIGVVRYPHHPFLARAVELRRNLTVYDALYVALAEALDAPLLTRDGGMGRSARRYVNVIHVD
jgi:predicted nucleic acid-binding protein